MVTLSVSQVGAASKGIIQRDFQHHATVFRSAYAKNPFDNVTDDELREYQRVVDAKSRNGECSSCSIEGVCRKLSGSHMMVFPLHSMVQEAIVLTSVPFPLQRTRTRCRRPWTRQVKRIRRPSAARGP